MIIRLIIGALVPVPIAGMVASIGWMSVWDFRIIELLFFYLFMILLGYWLVGIRSIGYSLIMEFVLLKVPFIRNHIILYTLFSAASIGLLTAIPFHLGDPGNQMLLFLGFFTGAVMALILYPLTKANLRNKQLHSDNLEEIVS
jgi:hypothetical protein